MTLSRATLFLLFLSLPVLVINWQILGMTITFPVLMIFSCAVFLALVFAIRGRLNTSRRALMLLVVFYCVPLIFSISDFFVGVLFSGSVFSVQLFLGNFLKLILNFILAVLIVTLIRVVGFERGIIISLSGAACVGAISSIYALSSQVFLFYGFDFPAFLAENFSFFDTERELSWSVQGVYRASGLAGINGSAIYYAMLLPSVWFLSFRPHGLQTKSKQRFFSFCLFLIMLGIISSFSRVAILITTLLGLFVLVRKAPLALVIGGVGAVALGVLFVSQELQLFFYDLANARLHLSSSRFLLWLGGLQLLEHHPFGVGLGQYYNYAKISYQDPNLYDLNLHNSWLDLLVAHGPIPFFSSLFVLIFIVGKLLSDDGVSQYVGSSLAIGCVAAMGNSVLGMFCFSGLLGLGVSCLTLKQCRSSRI